MKIIKTVQKQLNLRISKLSSKKIDIESIKEFNQYQIKSILKVQQRFKSERHNVFNEKINEITLSSNDNKKRKSFDSIETYVYETSENLVKEKEEIKCNNMTKEYINEHNSNWPQIPDHSYRLLTIGGSGSGDTNSMFNLISLEPDNGKNLLIC